METRINLEALTNASTPSTIITIDIISKDHKWLKMSSKLRLICNLDHQQQRRMHLISQDSPHSIRSTVWPMSPSKATQLECCRHGITKLRYSNAMLPSIIADLQIAILCLLLNRRVLSFGSIHRCDLIPTRSHD